MLKLTGRRKNIKNLHRGAISPCAEIKGDRMRRILCIIIIIIVLIVGVFLTIYPYLYNAYTEKHHSEVMDNYTKAVETISQEEIDSIKKSVNEYNSSLLNESVVLTDPFDPNAFKNHDSDTYAELLNIDGDGTIAILDVPKINIKLPVYHGTTDEILSDSLGHLEGTSMPIGGTGTHCVITGHTGLPNVKLFTDLTELETGDVFYIDVLNEILAYEIDNIAIVEPEDTDLLSISRDKDYVTLLTCYPYGINSHRLLVRGTRVPYEEAVVQEKNMEGTGGSSQWNREYLKTVAICGAGYGSVFIVFFIFKKRKKKKEENKDRE